MYSYFCLTLPRILIEWHSNLSFNEVSVLYVIKQICVNILSETSGPIGKYFYRNYPLVNLIRICVPIQNSKWVPELINQYYFFKLYWFGMQCE
jgi:hypothetical protein